MRCSCDKSAANVSPSRSLGDSVLPPLTWTAATIRIPIAFASEPAFHGFGRARLNVATDRTSSCETGLPLLGEGRETLGVVSRTEDRTQGLTLAFKSAR